MDIQLLTWIANRVLPTRIRRPIASSTMRLINWARYRDPYFFRAVSIEISKWCNRTCSYCPNSSFKTPKEFMPIELFDVALGRLQEIRWRGFVDYIFYNEPLADPRLVDLVARTKKALPHASPRIISNGDMLTEALAERLINAGVTSFIVTRHIPEKEGWRQRVQAVASKWPRYFTVLNSPGEVLWSNRGGLVDPEDFVPFTSCDAPENSLVITINGDVVLCCNDYHREHVVGNVQKKSLLEIWRTPWYEKVRKEVRDGHARLPICKACFGLPTGKPAPAPAANGQAEPGKPADPQPVAAAGR